jgi:Cu(I)/Ag(I) efflux system membrane protein CusA/SilA
VRGARSVFAERAAEGYFVDFEYIDTGESDIGGFVERAKEAARRVVLKSGSSMEWSGQYENMLRARERLKLVVPITN